MRKFTIGKLTSGLLAMAMMLFVFFSANVFAADEEMNTDAAAAEVGIKYYAHVENFGDTQYVNGPAAVGTTHQCLRLEGFCAELTGDVPAGASLQYEVHVQDYGWMKPVSAGQFAGTRHECKRVEAIKINLINLPGYDVYYRGHVENIGDSPMDNGDWGWVKNGEELGSTGDSQRLELIEVKIVKQTTATTTYDKAQTYGPTTGTQAVTGDAVISVPGVTLQNLHISGNLTIGEGVGTGDVTLNNVTVDGETFVYGGGKNSIHINGGSYNKITMEKTTSGEVRIVATDINGLKVVISENATGQAIILEGSFADVTVNAPNVNIQTQGTTTIASMTVAKEATGCEVNLAEGTKVATIVLDSAAAVKGEGTIDNAEVNSNGVTFETAPANQDVDPTVTEPPIVKPATPTPGGGSGGTDPSVAALAVVNAATDAADMQSALEGNASVLGLSLTKTYDDYTLTYETIDLARQTAIAADMLANKPGAPGYSLTTVQTYFDNLTHARIVIEEQLDKANLALSTNSSESLEDVDFIRTTVTDLGKITPNTLTLSKQTVGDLAFKLNAAVQLYDNHPMTSADRTAIRAGLKTSYSSLGDLLTDLKAAYISRFPDWLSYF